MVVLSMAKNKKKKAKKTGRPTQYKKRYCRMLIKFFDIEPFTEVNIPIYDESGKIHKSGRHKGEGVVTHYEVKRNPNRLPTLQRFAKKIGVSVKTVYNWIDEKHDSHKPEFLHAFACARVLRRNFVIENGLIGTHQHSYAKFVATNLTDMKDTQKQEISGVDGGPIPLKVVDFAKVDLSKLEDNETP